jgi:hypothetical protein
MRACLPLILLPAALAGCSSQTDKELEAVKSARSVIAEWALVEEQANKQQAQTIYVEQMRQLAKDQLKKDLQELSGRPDAAGLIGTLTADSPGADELNQADSALEPVETTLEAS